MSGPSTLSQDGNPWWHLETKGWAIGVSPDFPGLLADEAIRRQLGSSIPAAVQTATDHGAWRRMLRFGAASERLLWLIHRRVLQDERSTVRLADREAGRGLWGPEQARWPAHWRSTIRTLLESLTWLHVSPASEQGLPFNAMSAIVTFAADLRRYPGQDTCCENCPERHGGRHHHYGVRIGTAFLGALEGCAAETTGGGTRCYRFSDPRGLRQLARQNHLGGIYLPAKLGLVERTRRLSSSLHQVLQALMQEIERAPRDGQVTRGSQLVTDAIVPDFLGRPARCPFLDPCRQYLSFNGNGFRSGRGYLLSSPGGWCAKAGLSPDQPSAFLHSIAQLSAQLGQLVMVGVHRHHAASNDDAWISSNTLMNLATSESGHRLLSQVHVRIYAPHDALQAWSEWFRYTEAEPLRMTSLDELIALLARAGLSQRDLARHLGKDPSLISRYLSGQRRIPAVELDRALNLVRNQVSSGV